VPCALGNRNPTSRFKARQVDSGISTIGRNAVVLGLGPERVLVMRGRMA
jgi:hypothetical protein